jgi:AraC-like DNA-binding protein
VTAVAREQLAADPGLTLTALARAVGVSPHHLSRMFRAWTGTTVTRYRMRLRARAALERIAEGERDLAALAADLGLADQSHLNRVLRAESGRTPTQLRQLLRGSVSPAGAVVQSNRSRRGRDDADHAHEEDLDGRAIRRLG